MIFELIVSLAIVCASTELCVLTSGGFFSIIFNPVLLLGIIVIFAVMIFLSGYGKWFLKLFCTPEKFRTMEMPELKKLHAAVDFAVKALVYICVFFMFISAIYFYLNFEETQTLGVNLSTVMCSIIYLAFLELILLTLRTKVKGRIISFMAEEIDFAEVKVPRTKKQTAVSIIKTVLSVACITFFYLLTIYSNTVNHSHEEPLTFYYLRDLPGLIYAFVPSFLLLTVSGNFKNFFKSVSAVFKGQKFSVVQKGLYVNALQMFRLTCIVQGILTALCGYMGIMCNLEDKAALGIAFTVAGVPFIYGMLVNLILLPVEGKLSGLCDCE